MKLAKEEFFTLLSISFDYVGASWVSVQNWVYTQFWTDTDNHRLPFGCHAFHK